MLVLSVVIILGASAGALAAIGALRWPQADPARSASKTLEGSLTRGSRIGLFLRSRLDPATTTGLALTVALLAVVIAGTAMGVVVYMVRTNSGVVRVDQYVERWAAFHVEGLSLQALRLLTALGSTLVIILLAGAGAVYGWWQRRSFSIPLFIALVVGGQALMSTLIKIAVDRVRPDIGPLGVIGTPSFPSGHSTAAAATFAALALVVGRGRSPKTRATLTGVAVAMAVAVACSRVLLSAHWFSDVISGLALGWTWFAICAVAFGGRLLWYGAAAKEAASSRGSSSSSPPGVLVEDHRSSGSPPGRGPDGASHGRGS
jgi:membrane-associated phospholipid phosphatase